MSKVNFSSIPSHNKKVASTNVNPTKEECKTIYENIKNGLPIVNPKSKFPIVYHSPITQKILRICYTKYKMKKLPDVIDPRNLFGNKTPPQVSSASSGSPSPPGAKVKKQSSSPKYGPPTSPLSLPSPPGSSPKYGPPGTPSPPSSLPTSPLPPPSPPAARKKSPAKLKKLSFEGVNDTIKTTAQKKPYNNLTTNDCMYVVDQCRDVMKKIADGNKNKHQIVNPISQKGILYTSPITKYLLYSCYYDKNIKDVEEVVEIKTLCDKPPAIKNNYTDILTKFKDLKLNYTEDTENF